MGAKGSLAYGAGVHLVSFLPSLFASAQTHMANKFHIIK